MTRSRKYRPCVRRGLLTLALAVCCADRARADQPPASLAAPAAPVAPAAPPPAAGAPPPPTAATATDPGSTPTADAAPAAASPPAAPVEKVDPAAAAGPAPEPLTESAPSPTQSASATLKVLTETGVRLYERGDFSGAIQSFSAGYALRPNPVFLFNIAQAYRKSGQDQSALSFYGKFIAASPQSPYRAEAEAYIAYLRGKLGLDRPPPPPPPPPRVYKKPWFWAVLGSAAVTAGVAVTLGIVLGTRDPPTTLGTVEPRFR
jgi:tetratricopeptide (TPR) repeat protein